MPSKKNLCKLAEKICTKKDYRLHSLSERSVLRIAFYKKNGSHIFKEDMLLITSLLIAEDDIQRQ